MHEPLEQERRNGVCLHCLTPSNIHGSKCPSSKRPIDRTATAAAMTYPNGVGVALGSKKDAIMNTQFPFEGPSCLQGLYALGTALYAWVQWNVRRSILKTSSPDQEFDLCVVSDDIPESDNDDCEVCLLHRTLSRLCHFPKYVPTIQLNLCLKFINLELNYLKMTRMNCTKWNARTEIWDRSSHAPVLESPASDDFKFVESRDIFCASGSLPVGWSLPGDTKTVR